MKQNFKTKFTGLILGVGLILGSCGTSNDVVNNGVFTKRKYTDGYHSNFKKNFKSDEVKNETDVILNTENQTSVVSTVQSSKNQTKVDQIKSEKTSVTEVPVVIENSNIQLQAEEGVEVAERNTNLKQTNVVTDNLKENKTVAKVVSMKRATKKMAPQPKKDSGFLRVLFMIILAILLIALIQMLLPGLIGNIISLVLLILIIVFILKLFGVF